MFGPLLLVALAAAPEILLPPWPLSPDGELVAVRGAEPLRAEAGTVEGVAPGLHRVIPAEGAREVRLVAGRASAVASVEAPPADITIAFTPGAPVKGRDAVALEITVGVAPGADPEARPPEIVASVGRVRSVSAAGPGRFRAVYEPPPTRHPEVAVLLALAPRCPTCPTPRAVGHAIVPLSAAIDLPGTSDPGVKTTVTIAGRSFGPVMADRQGRFTVPVVVPPGAHRGVADSVDAIGNRRRKEIDLHLPKVNRLACEAWPRAVPADGRSSAAVWCVASSEGGTPEAGAKLALSARPGEISAASPFRGALQRATFQAPRGGAGTEAVLTASYPDAGPASGDELRVGLVPGAPAEIAAEVAAEPVPLGAAVAARTAVRDVNGDVVGSPSGPPGTREGFVAPDRFVARTEPGDYVQRAPLSFALPPGKEVATLSLRRERGAWIAAARTVEARPAAGTPLRFGSGATAVTDARGEARAPALGAHETVTAANGARAAGFEGFAPPSSPFELARTVTVALRPSSPVDVVAGVEGGWVHWRILDPGGKPLPGRDVVLKAKGILFGPPERDADGGRAPLRVLPGEHGPVAVVDAATGVAAVVEVP